MSRQDPLISKPFFVLDSEMAMNGTARLVVIILLVLLLLGALPTWPYSSGWGYYPSGGLGLLLLIIIVVMLLGGGGDRRLR